MCRLWQFLIIHFVHAKDGCDKYLFLSSLFSQQIIFVSFHELTSSMS